MPVTPAPLALTEADYEVIEQAVMETARGRWFLSEYAQRNRHSDTKLVLDAIQKLQRSVLGADVVPEIAPTRSEVRADLGEMERMIERTKRELAGIDAARVRDGDLAKELQQIVEAASQAIAEVLSDAERIQEIAWTMREQGLDASKCDQLDGLATHINTACAFQDLTGQRTGKVAATLHVFEERVHSLVKLWQVESEAPAQQVLDEKALLNGPARNGEGLEQNQVDELLSIDKNHDVFWGEESAPAETPAPPAARVITRGDIEKLSTEERLALFS